MRVIVAARHLTGLQRWKQKISLHHNLIDANTGYLQNPVDVFFAFHVSSHSTSRFKIILFIITSSNAICSNYYAKNILQCHMFDFIYRVCVITNDESSINILIYRFHTYRHYNVIIFQHNVHVLLHSSLV